MIKDSWELEGESSEGSLNKQVFSYSKTLFEKKKKKRPWPALPRVLLMVEFTAVNSVAVTPTARPPQTAGFAEDQVLIKEASLGGVKATRMLIPLSFIKDMFCPAAPLIKTQRRSILHPGSITVSQVRAITFEGSDSRAGQGKRDKKRGKKKQQETTHGGDDSILEALGKYPDS